MVPLRKYRGFTLVELLISLFIAGIIFASVFAMVRQFGNIYQSLSNQVQDANPSSLFIEQLKNDLAKTGFVKFNDNKSYFILKYMLPIDSRKKGTLIGREVVVNYHKIKRELKIDEKNFQWTLEQYIDDFESEKQLLGTTTKTIALPLGYRLQARAIKEAERIILISMIELHTVDGNDNIATHLLRVGRF